MSFDLSDYVDVRARIEMFREKYPNGSLQPANPIEPFRVVIIGDKTFIAYTACAYRTPDDPRPGIGTAWEPVPGRTPYTKDSELMNAETSAWGRAIVAVLAVDRNQPIASADEVRNRQTAPTERGTVVPLKPASPQARQIDRPASAPAAAPKQAGSGPAATPKQHAFIRSLATRLELGDADVAKIAGMGIEDMAVADAKRVIDSLLAVQKGEASIVFGDDGTISIVTDDGRG